VDMHASDLVGINGITRVLLVYTCQQGVFAQGHILPLRLHPMFIVHKVLNFMVSITNFSYFWIY
jgi:hypothetical protein